MKVHLQGSPKSPKSPSRSKDVRGILIVDTHFQVTLQREQQWTPPLAMEEHARFLESGPRHILSISAHMIGDKRYQAAFFLNKF